MAWRDDWNLRMVKAREAWALLPKRPDGGIDWGDTQVAHLDTGYTPHPLFGNSQNGSRWIEPEAGIDGRRRRSARSLRL